MKGIIVYSSLTGNTKRMAEYIYKGLKNDYEVDILNVNEKINEDLYEFALVGGWVDKGNLDKKALEFIKNSSIKKIGIFGTMGASPHSLHGIYTRVNIEELLKEKESLGVLICRGKVSDKLIEGLKKATDEKMPSNIKEQMLKISVESVEASEEELFIAKEYFKAKIEKIKKRFR